MRLIAAISTVAAAIAVPGVAPAQAGSDLAAARGAGIVGERYDGYLGFARTPSQALRNRAGAVNIKRRALYTGLANRRGVTRNVAEIAAGCELLSRIAVGEVYLLADGAWHRRDPGEPPPSPDHCPG